MEPILYPGDNGHQEFFESKDGNYLILRLRKETVWTAYANNLLIEDDKATAKQHYASRIYLGDVSISNLIKRWEKQEDLKISISREMIWVKNMATQDGMPMKLVKDGTVTIEICSECGRSVKEGTGLFVDRIPDFDSPEERENLGRPFPQGDFLCRECDAKAE